MSLASLTLDELVARRQHYGEGWDEAFARDDIDSCEALMEGIRALSDEIAKRTQEPSISGAAVIEPVSIGHSLSLSVDDADESVGDLSDCESEGSEASGSVSELTLSQPSSVLSLQGVPLSVHQEADSGEGVLGSGHDPESTDDCVGCAMAHGRHAAWIEAHS